MMVQRKEMILLLEFDFQALPLKWTLILVMRIGLLEMVTTQSAQN
ncbi:unnamed protein product [Prunus brigantina]